MPQKADQSHIEDRPCTPPQISKQYCIRPLDYRTGGVILDTRQDVNRVFVSIVVLEETNKGELPSPNLPIKIRFGNESFDAKTDECGVLEEELIFQESNNSEAVTISIPGTTVNLRRSKKQGLADISRLELEERREAKVREDIMNGLGSYIQHQLVLMRQELGKERAESRAPLKAAAASLQEEVANLRTRLETQGELVEWAIQELSSLEIVDELMNIKGNIRAQNGEIGILKSELSSLKRRVAEQESDTKQYPFKECFISIEGEKTRLECHSEVCGLRAGDVVKQKDEIGIIEGIAVSKQFSENMTYLIVRLLDGSTKKWIIVSSGKSYQHSYELLTRWGGYDPLHYKFNPFKGKAFK
jgi:hypothetical protein